MLSWALGFLLVALAAAILGFVGVAGTAIGVAKFVFFVAILLFALAVAWGLVTGPGRRTG